MDNKRVIIKGAGIGIAIFIAGEIITRGYGLLCMNLFNGKEWSLLSAVMSLILGMLLLLFHFFSKAFLALGGKGLIHSSMELSRYSVFILRGLDLIFWIGLSVMILFIIRRRNKSK